jgi:hypothetical protein
VTSPIGALLIEAGEKAKKKATKVHTSTAKDCGCQVTVTWFSEKSTSNKIERCHLHSLPADRKTR